VCECCCRWIIECTGISRFYQLAKRRQLTRRKKS
jgi:hypothetical protein